MLLACPHCDQLNRIPDQRLAEKPRCGHCKALLLAGSPLTLTGSNFENQVEKSGLPIVVDFWAEWCGPCRSFAPVFSLAAKELEPAFRFGKVNTEQQPALAARFGIRSIPTLILFRQGQIIAQQSGALPRQAFYQWLDSYR